MVDVGSLRQYGWRCGSRFVRTSADEAEMKVRDGSAVAAGGN
jgi:hypothetical protein